VSGLVISKIITGSDGGGVVIGMVSFAGDAELGTRIHVES
jgi:hypothetical protein